LYEMITGRMPFEAENEAAVQYNIVNGEPEPLARYKTGAAGELQQFIDKSLAKDPSLRYQHADGMLADLKRLQMIPSDLGGGGVTGKGRNRLGSRFWSSLAAVAAVTFLLVCQPWRLVIRSGDEAPAVQSKLLITPFENLAEPGDPNRIGEMVASLLITNISQSQAVSVVSKQRQYDLLKQLGGVMGAVADPELVPSLVDKAGARWLLQGTVIQDTSAFILIAELTESKSGNLIAALRADGQAGETLFSLVDRMAREVVTQLAPGVQETLDYNPNIADLGTNSLEAYRHYLEGMDYRSKYLGQQAVACYQRAVAIDSTFAMAYFQLHMAGVPGALDSAIRYMDRTSDVQRMWIRAAKATSEDDWDRGIELLREIIVRDPEEKEAYYQLGNILDSKRDKQGAITAYKKAIEIDPLYKRAYNSLAFMYDDVGDLDSSIWAINKYIEIAPDEPNPYHSRGELYAHHGKIDEAMDSYGHALEIDSEYAAADLSVASLYLLQGKYDRSDSILRKLATGERRSYRRIARQALSLSARHQGKFQEALRILAIAAANSRLESGETSYEAVIHFTRSAIFNLFTDYGDSAIAAAELAEEIVKRRSPRVLSRQNIMGALAVAYEFAGMESAADSILRELRPSVDEHGISREDNYTFFRAYVERHRGNYDSAIVYWETTAEYHATFAELYELGVTYVLAGRPADGITVLEPLLLRYDGFRASWPDFSVLMHYYLGMAYEQSGWNERAIEQYETFLDIWKNADEGLESVEDAKERLARLEPES